VPVAGAVQAARRLHGVRVDRLACWDPQNPSEDRFAPPSQLQFALLDLAKIHASVCAGGLADQRLARRSHGGQTRGDVNVVAQRGNVIDTVFGTLDCTDVRRLRWEAKLLAFHRAQRPAIIPGRRAPRDARDWVP